MLTIASFNQIADKLTSAALTITPQDSYVNTASTTLTKFGSNGGANPVVGIGDKLGLMVGNTLPTNDYGMLQKLRQLRDMLFGINLAQTDYPTLAVDNDALTYLLTSLNGALAVANYQNVLFTLLGPVVNAFNNFCQASGVAAGLPQITSIDTFASYYNYGGGAGTYGWNCPLSPDWISLYSAVFGTTPSVLNIFAPTPAGVVATVTTFNTTTAYGTLVNTQLYANAGSVKFAGLVPNAGPPTNLTANIQLASTHGLATGNYVMIFNGTGVTLAGAAFAGGATGHYWTSTVLAITNGVAFNNAAVAITPATNGDVLQQVTSVGIYASPYTQPGTALQTTSGTNTATLSYVQPRTFANITA